MEIERRAWMDQVEVRAAADGRSRIVQRAVPFGELSVDLGGFREVIVAGAFDVEGRDIRSLWQHDATRVLGRTTNGTLALRVEEDGIYAESIPPDTTWARDALISIERGDVTSSSFAFYVDEDEWLATGQDVIRRVLRGTLVEVSPVTWAAYPQTSVGVQQRAADLRARAVGADDNRAEGFLRAREALRRRVDVRKLIG